MYTIRKLTAGAVVFALIFSSGGEAGADTAPLPPRVAPAEQRFLVWAARRAVEDHLAERSTGGPAHCPAALAEVRCPAAVTLRRGGQALAVGVSPEGAVLQATQWAATEAAKVARSAGLLDLMSLDTVRVEIELLGRATRTPMVPYWGSIQSYSFVEPGVHGVILQLNGATAAMRPSEFVSHYTSVRSALRSLNERMNPDHGSCQGMLASWFRSTHFHEVEPRGRVVELHRGLSVLRPEDVTRAALDETINRLTDFVLYRQRPDGGFAYQYLPAAHTYSDTDNATRQAESAWSLAVCAQTTGDQKAGAAARKAIGALCRHVVDLEGVEGAGFHMGPDGGSDLGATAFLCLALTDGATGADGRVIRDRLVRAMTWRQQPDGRFITMFPPALEERRDRSTSAGQALLALVRAGGDHSSVSVDLALENALGFYRERLDEDRWFNAAPWHLRAYAEAARLYSKPAYAEFAFEMADRLVARQLDAGNCPWPELHGAFTSPERRGVDSAAGVHLHSLTDALALARRVGPAVRAAKYERAVRAAVRYVMQLQFRREEGYYVRSGIDCYGGIRHTPWDSRLRIDRCAQALAGLVRAREVLYAEGEGAVVRP
ncbi:MAG: hypothetical protein GY842_05010 [bacterium]|nr:hypothetical protein [bacterium]